MDVVGVLDVEEGEGHDGAEHDPERGPHLPHHDERAADDGRGALGGVDGHRRGFGADAEAEDEAGDEEVLPGVGDALPDAGGEGDEGGDEDGPATAEVLVERGGQPAAEDTTAELDGGEYA